jgi:hypothetical protein
MTRLVSDHVRVANTFDQPLRGAANANRRAIRHVREEYGELAAEASSRFGFA